MTIQKGDLLPQATFMKMGDKGAEAVDSQSLFAGRRVALFGLPGAYTGTCSTLHVPSFMRVAPALRDHGVDEIICVSVNDPFVMKAWGEASGGSAAGITFLADPEAAFTRAIGLEFSAPVVGLYNRCQRFSALVQDGRVALLNLEPTGGQCNLTAGETLLEQIQG